MIVTSVAGQVFHCLHVPLKFLTAIIVFQTKEY